MGCNDTAHPAWSAGPVPPMQSRAPHADLAHDWPTPHWPPRLLLARHQLLTVIHRETRSRGDVHYHRLRDLARAQLSHDLPSRGAITSPACARPDVRGDLPWEPWTCTGASQGEGPWGGGVASAGRGSQCHISSCTRRTERLPASGRTACSLHAAPPGPGAQPRGERPRFHVPTLSFRGGGRQPTSVAEPRRGRDTHTCCHQASGCCPSTQCPSAERRGQAPSFCGWHPRRPGPCPGRDPTPACGLTPRGPPP